MFAIDVHEHKGERFRVLQTTDRTQVAIMTLSTSPMAAQSELHAESDQVGYVIEGRVEVTVGGETKEMRAGEMVVIPAGTPHRFRAVGRRSATVVNFYGPPAYPQEEREIEPPVAGRELFPAAPAAPTSAP